MADGKGTRAAGRPEERRSAKIRTMPQKDEYSDLYFQVGRGFRTPHLPTEKSKSNQEEGLQVTKEGVIAIAASNSKAFRSTVSPSKSASKQITLHSPLRPTKEKTKKKKKPDASTAPPRDFSVGAVRATPLRKAIEKKTAKPNDEQPKQSKKNLLKAAATSKVANVDHRTELNHGEKAGSAGITNSKHFSDSPADQGENSKYRMPISSPLVLNREQKQKLSELLEKANSSGRSSRIQDEYLLQAKLSKLKPAKSKGLKKQKVFYCDTQNSRLAAFGNRPFVGTQSSKNFYSLKPAGKGHLQEPLKVVPSASKKLLIPKSQSKSQTQFFLSSKGDLKKNKKKTASDAKTAISIREGVAGRTKETRVQSNPDNLVPRLLADPKPTDRYGQSSCSNSKTTSKVMTAAKEAASFRQSEEIRDQISNDNHTASSRDGNTSNVHSAILKKIQMRRDLEHNIAAIVIQKHVRGWLDRKLALKVRVLRNPYRNQKSSAKTSGFEPGIMKASEHPNAGDLFKKPFMHLRSARTNTKVPISNKESVGPANGTPTNVFSRVKLSKSWVETGDNAHDQKKSLSNSSLKPSVEKSSVEEPSAVETSPRIRALKEILAQTRTRLTT